jgi:hypothetical protein
MIMVALCACTGDIAGAPVTPREAGDGSDPMAGPEAPAPGPATASPAPMTPGQPAPPVCSGPSPGPAPLRRLTNFELNRTLRDLLGDGTRPADAFPPDPVLAGFDNDAESLVVSGELAQLLFATSRDIAERATAGDLVKLAGCDPVKTGEATCGRRFVESFGSRAWRRPLEAAEITRLAAVFDAGLVDEGWKGALERVIRVVVQAPQFLYRVELPPPGAGPSVVRPHELATRLSYLLWGTVPDSALTTAARSGRLVSAAQVREQAVRMLADARAKEVVRRFHELWLQLDEMKLIEKDARAFPAYQPFLGQYFERETESFIDHVVWQGPGTFAALMSAPYTVMNDRIAAAVYGRKDVTGPEYRVVELDPRQRAGFLTQPGMMSALAKPDQTEPIFRGVYVRTHLLCDPPPPPPDAVVETFMPVPVGLTGRERLRAHLQDPSCASCHRLIDGIGLGFESLDGIGRWRDLDAKNKPVDARGEVVGTDVGGTFRGPVELMQKIAGSAQARGCMVGKYFQFAYGRLPTAADACSLAQLDDAFKSGGYKIRDLLLALTQTDAFVYTKGGS